jgi:hypothetical protein
VLRRRASAAPDRSRKRSYRSGRCVRMPMDTSDGTRELGARRWAGPDPCGGRGPRIETCAARASMDGGLPLSARHSRILRILSSSLMPSGALGRSETDPAGYSVAQRSCCEFAGGSIALDDCNMPYGSARGYRIPRKKRAAFLPSARAQAERLPGLPLGHTLWPWNAGTRSS